VPPELIVRSSDAFSHWPERSGRKWRTLARRECRVACQPRNPELALHSFVIGLEIFVSQRPIIRYPVESADAKI